ncbi:phage tail terminator-like protein [Collimonas humicola]|uniref:phage tail terminator-like protein n=1 Tax=Collimonas humicola TaxID=2825886 RepID=UPI001B8B5A1C|nr:phage tail terminator-like protein [Collimonas humicola]
MSLPEIRAALETQLATVSPLLATAYENMPFTPVAGVPYLKPVLMPAETTNPTFGDNFHRESGIFQVMLCYPTLAANGGLQGSGASGQMANLIRNAFRRGQSFSYSGVTVQIDRTPTVSTGMIVGDRYCVPVRIRYYADIYA